jgi:carboxyl-terminal processing protease
MRKSLFTAPLKEWFRVWTLILPFLTKEEHQDLLIETKGSFSGVGIEITVRDNFLTVVSPIEGTPAYKAGIQAGDRIIKIDGKPTADMTLPEAVKEHPGGKGDQSQPDHHARRGG